MSMAARAIPRRMLIHSAQHKTEKATDEWGNEAWSPGSTLSYVRFEPTNKLAMSKDNNEVQLSLLMFFDTRNSLPNGRYFSVGECIEWENEEYIIITAERLYDDERLHHWEVGLV